MFQLHLRFMHFPNPFPESTVFQLPFLLFPRTI